MGVSTTADSRMRRLTAARTAISDAFRMPLASAGGDPGRAARASTSYDAQDAQGTTCPPDVPSAVAACRGWSRLRRRFARRGDQSVHKYPRRELECRLFDIGQIPLATRISLETGRLPWSLRQADIQTAGYRRQTLCHISMKLQIN
jgi:hypothetical protein